MNYTSKLILTDKIIAFLIFILFIAVVSFLPVYDTQNGFHNQFFGNYTVTWQDGRSPLNFLFIKSFLNNEPPISLTNITSLSDNYDVRIVNDQVVPIFNLLPTYIYATLLYPLKTFLTNDLALFKAILVLNVLVYALSLVVFYFLCRRLGLSQKNAFFATIVLGFSTSFIIYSHYFFLVESLTTLSALFLLYLLSDNVKNEFVYGILIAVISVLFVAQTLVAVVGISLVFSLILWFEKFVTKKTVIVTLIFALLFSSLYASYGPSSHYLARAPSSPFWDFLTIGQNFIPATNFEIYGFYNVTSGSLLQRVYSYVYGFAEQPGNAIFLSFYGLFASLFSEKGFVYNSPFLIFSILGLFVYQKNRHFKNLLSLITIFLIISIGFLSSIWYGGYTPRYVRGFDIPVAILTFFAFYYMQKLWSEKNKLKKILITTIFIGLIILSVLNVFSLAIRTDWTYETTNNLVSYDLVLWPWITPTTFDISAPTEQMNWNLTGESYCRAAYNYNGIVTDSCDCKFNSTAIRTIFSNQQEIKFNVIACADYAGGDGTIGNVIFDSQIQSIFIPSNSCNSTTLVFNVSQISTSHTLALQSGIYGNCSAEATTWKDISVANNPN